MVVNMSIKDESYFPVLAVAIVIVLIWIFDGFALILKILAGLVILAVVTALAMAILNKKNPTSSKTKY